MVSAILFFFVVGTAKADTLNIDPVIQHIPKWCWAAVSEMVFRFYSVPAINPINYQCGIVSGMHPVCSANCFACNFTAPNLIYLRSVLTTYSNYAEQYTGFQSGTLVSDTSYAALTQAQVRTEIDGSRPIIVGLSPSGFSYDGQPQHAALIIGYENGDSNLEVIVNDPYPYDLSFFSGITNPYIAAGGRLIIPGQYQITYVSFKSRLTWTQALKNIRCIGSSCP